MLFRAGPLWRTPVRTLVQTPLLPSGAFLSGPYNARSVVELEHAKRRFIPLLLLLLVTPLLTTIHYFAPISVGLLIVGDLLAGEELRRRASSRALVLLVAAAAFVVCLPILIEQRSVLGGSTWILPPSAKDIMEYPFAFVNRTSVTVALLLAEVDFPNRFG